MILIDAILIVKKKVVLHNLKAEYIHKFLHALSHSGCFLLANYGLGL